MHTPLMVGYTAGDTFDRDPKKLPTAVRLADTIYTLDIIIVRLGLS